MELVGDWWSADGAPDPVARRTGGQVGSSLSRVDGRVKVTGAARYAAEVSMPEMTYAALAHSTIAKGRVVGLDVGAAEQAEGVVFVMTHANAPRMSRPHEIGTMEKAASGDDLPVMQDDRIRWNGQPIALVLAETPEQAQYAASLIGARYDEEPSVTSVAEARRRARRPEPSFGDPLRWAVGDAEAALASSPYAVDATYRTPRQNHNAIEPHAATMAWVGDELIVHDCTQCVSHLAWSLAEVFGIDEKKVRVSAPFIGGAFGGKTLWQHQILAAAAAKVSRRPVRMTLTREGTYRVVGGRTATEQRVAIGAGEDGRFRALIHTGLVATTAQNHCPEPFIGPASCLYRAGAHRLELLVADMDMVANTFMRAPGEAVGTFALECAIDELADRAGIDPVELRLSNEPATEPRSGLPFSSRHLTEAYRLGGERFGWRRRCAKPRARREGEWFVGLGCATATYPYKRIPGSAARLTMNTEDRVTVEIAAHDMGMGTATVQTQVTAERLGLPLDRVSVRLGDSSLPGLVLAGGSQQTVAIGAAVIAAQRQLVAQLLSLTRSDSPLAGLAPDEVGAVDRGLRAICDPSRYERYGAILRGAGRSEIAVIGEAPGREELAYASMHSFGAQFCEVRVSAVTGEIRVSRLVGAFDCGRILNAKTAASQLRGGIVMGLGLALMEETCIDERTGRIVNPSLSQYHVPVHLDVPEIDVLWTDRPDPIAPMGAHGVGEIGVTGVAAAVANAVYNATGVRVRDLPITLDRVLAGNRLAVSQLLG